MQIPGAADCHLVGSREPNGGRELGETSSFVSAISPWLSVEGAEFWVNDSPGCVVGDSIRMILTVEDPDALFIRALSAGATEVFPIRDEHGWRVGRLVDPYGFHWEIGRPFPQGGM